MKIKKNKLHQIIESYLLESSLGPDQMVGTDKTMPGDKYPEYITTANQRQQYDIMKAADRRRLEHPDSEAGLRWPQDFVLFEKEFEQHIENWRLFKRTHPKSALALQLFDLSGVSSYSDLADSIKLNNSGNTTMTDDIVFFLNVIGSLPIGVIAALKSGRLGVKALNAIKSIGKDAFVNQKLVNIPLSILKASGNFTELFSRQTMKEFLKNSQVAKSFKDLGVRLTDDLIEKIVAKIEIVTKLLDSFVFRSISNFCSLVVSNMGSELGSVFLQEIGGNISDNNNDSNIANQIAEEEPELVNAYLINKKLK